MGNIGSDADQEDDCRLQANMELGQSLHHLHQVAVERVEEAEGGQYHHCQHGQEVAPDGTSVGPQPLRLNGND